MPRKTESVMLTFDDGKHASMRPRPDAAENVHFGRVAYRRPPASMRPRPDAAENTAVNGGYSGTVPLLQ